MADVTVPCPHRSGTCAARNHGHPVYDTLFGTGGAQTRSPRMAEAAATEEDGRRRTVTLRQGLRFRDGEPVPASGRVASTRRRALRTPLGGPLVAGTDDLPAADDRRIIVIPKRPFPPLPAALGKVPTVPPAMLPAPLARTDGAIPLEAVGSGPHRPVAEERIAGHRTVQERFAGHRSREGGGMPDRIAACGALESAAPTAPRAWPPASSRRRKPVQVRRRRAGDPAASATLAPVGASHHKRPEGSERCSST